MANKHPDMPKVFSVEDLQKKLGFHYARVDLLMKLEVESWLESLPALEAAIVRWLNAAITNASKSALRRAVMNRTQRILFYVDLDKTARAMLGKVQDDQRDKVPPEKLVSAFLLLAEEAGYQIADGKIVVDYLLTTKVDTKKMSSPTSGAKALKGVSDAEEVMELDAEDIEPLLEVLVGHVYSNKKGVFRKVTSIDGEQVKYEVVKSEAKRTRVGATGSATMKSFLSWSEEDVTTTWQADPNVPR